MKFKLKIKSKKKMNKLKTYFKKLHQKTINFKM